MKFERYVKGSVDYTDYSELKDNFSIEIPENFNFAYDVVDEYARMEPNRTALVWCDDNGGERVFSFQDLYYRRINFLPRRRGIRLNTPRRQR